MKRWIRKAVDSVTFRQYSLVQAIGWLILGNIADGHVRWWVMSLIAFGIFLGTGIINEVIRAVAGLPRQAVKGRPE